MRVRPHQRRTREPTIALINIVFLMLVFFMVAGTLSQPLDKTLRLVETADLEGSAPLDALVIYADGRLSYQGNDVPGPARFVASLPEDARTTLRVLPDRALPARLLVSTTRALRDAGAEKILLVTERGAK